jgi:hypothetical protein
MQQEVSKVSKAPFTPLTFEALSFSRLFARRRWLLSLFLAAPVTVAHWHVHGRD